MKNVIFWHVYLTGNYKILVQEQLLKLITSGLYAASDSITVGIASETDEHTDWILKLFQSFSKIKPVIHPCELKYFEERLTLRLISEYVKFEQCYVLYFHTKGITQINEYTHALWRLSMEYNTIYRWKECIAILNNGADAVGINLRYNTHVGYYPHFSGNFWWSTAAYLKTLNNQYLYDMNILGNRNRLTGEFWIGSNQNAKLYSIFECKDDAPYKVDCLISEYVV